MAEPERSEARDSPSPKRDSSSAGLAQLGRYRLCLELAKGGMATVFLAHAVGPGRFQKFVALKRIHPHLVDRTDFVDMFHDEAAIAARISHPNVAQVFDFGEDRGAHFIAMEFLLGEPLGQLMKACRARPEAEPLAHAKRIVRVIADTCEGLHAAHELRDDRGELLEVVHRDVSPDNIFVTYDGNVKLVDFGVASARNRVTQTTTGTIKGKHAYMAPELLSDAGFDRRADLFSVGVVLWEALTLERLFRRDSHARTLMAVMGDPIPLPSSVRAGLPPELDAIVMRALARDPADRFATAREMATALRAYASSRDGNVGPEEIERWVSELVPEGMARKRRLLSEAEALVSRPAGEPSASSEAEVSVSIDLGSAFDAAAEARPAPPAEAASPWPARARAAMLALIALALVAIGALLGGGLRTAPTSSAGASADARPAQVADEESEVPAGEREPVDAGAGTSEGDPGPMVEAIDATPVDGGAREPRARARSDGPPGELRVGLRARGGALPDDAWAEVRLDGRALSESPPFTLSVPAGRHVVEVRPYGRGARLRRTVHVASGERAVVVFDVEPP